MLTLAPTLTLAIDTTAEDGSIALVRDGVTLAEKLLHAPEGFSGILFGEIDAMLQAQGFVIGDVDLFAAASGPGSFTGVRIGLAAIKGLAEVLGKPAIPVSNLEALSRFGTAARRATVIDARRGEVFAALYCEGRQEIPEQVIPFDRFVEQLGDRDFEWVRDPRPLAVTIAAIAAERIAEGATGEPATIEANYVRRSDAELLWREPTC